MKAIKSFIDNVLRAVMALSSLVLFIVTFMQVVWRFVLKSPLPWSQDVIRLCFTYLVFLGAAYCVKENAHLGIDVVVSLLKPKARRAVDLLISLVLLAFFVFLAYYGVAFTQTGGSQMAPYLPLRMSFYYASVPVSAVLMVFYMLLQLAEQLRALGKNGEGR